MASSTYQIFSKGTGENFSSPNSNNVIGQGSEEFLWAFNSDGSITQVKVTKECQIDRNQDFQMTSKSFNSGDSLRFLFAQDSSLILGEAGLSVARLFIDGVSMSLVANGHQLEVERMLISSGASMELIGDGLMANTRVLQLDGTTDTQIILNMDGRADVNVLDGGTLELKQGGTAYNYFRRMSNSGVYVKDGGTLLLGNQKDTTDYSDTLGIYLTSGATVGAAAGDHDVTIYHSLINPVAGATVNFLTEANRTLTIASALGNMHANVVGDGALKLANVGSAKTISLAADELTLSDAKFSKVDIKDSFFTVAEERATVFTVVSRYRVCHG